MPAVDLTLLRAKPSRGTVLINPSPSEQNGCHFTDDILKFISMNEIFCISIRVSLNFVPKGPIAKCQ